MNTRQESKVNMYLTVKDYLTVNVRTMNSLPNFSEFFTTFQNSIAQIQACGEQQLFSKTGIAVNKHQLKDNLILLASDTLRRLTAYAKFVNNQVLLGETKFAESDLKKVADSTLRDYTQGIYDRAQVNLAALAVYGVTEATQSALQDAITAFVSSIPKPRLGITERKQSTLQLVNYFDAADGALENMDLLVEIVKVSHANFYNGYKSARKVLNTGGGSLALKGFVTDAITGEPLKGVSLSFSPNGHDEATKATGEVSGKSEVVLTKRTADKGGFMVKSLPEGVYSVTVTKNGYKDQVVTVTVTDGELSDLNVEMMKS